MEEKKSIKVSFGTYISVVIIFVLLIVGGILFYKENKRSTDLENVIAEQKTNIENMKATIENLKATKVAENTVANNTATKTEVVNNDGINNEHYKNKVDSKYKINIENGVPTISTTIEKKALLDIGWENSRIKLDNTQQKITGFTKKVVDVVTIRDEHTALNACFIFLMEDGTLEYSTEVNMIENVSTQGKIEGLENIVKLQKYLYSSYDIEDTSAMAIDKNNVNYNVESYLKTK